MMGNLKVSSPCEVRFLHLLRNKKHRDKILKNPTKKELQYLRNICYQITHGNIKMTPQKQRQLKKYKKSLRILADKKKKRVGKHLVMSGGAFGILAPLLVALASHLGGKLFNKTVPV